MSLKSFFNQFLEKFVIKPSPTVIKNIIDDKDFLVGEAFDNEADAQKYPTPKLIYSLIKMLIKVQSKTLLETRGLIPNFISILIGLAFAYTIRAPSESSGPIKPLVIAIKLI